MNLGLFFTFIERYMLLDTTVPTVVYNDIQR